MNTVDPARLSGDIELARSSAGALGPTGSSISRKCEQLKTLKTFAKDWLKSSFDISVSRHSRLIAEGEKLKRATDDLTLLQSLPNDHAARLVANMSGSKSQLRQDLFVLSQLQFKQNGFFVEFGATNGVDLSNSHLLEKKFGWTGILAEPARCWHDALKKNRTATIEHRCVWTKSGETLAFNEVDIAELSTINTFSDNDLHKVSRQSGTTYNVQTISLNELLSEHKAPSKIDYLSIDTEGSEYEILSNFDFTKHTFQIITCEHNYTSARENIFELLSRQGYRRMFENLSRFDDWYVKASA